MSGKQKAAMLLMSLDAGTAAELVKGLDAEVVRELAVEVAYLDAAGYRSSKESLALTAEFCQRLTKTSGPDIDEFLSEMLKSSVGGERAEQIRSQIEVLLHRRDPFMAIRSSESEKLGAVLGSQHPQIVAAVLRELSPRKSSEILGFLKEDLRQQVVARLTCGESVSSEARVRIAEAITRRLEAKGQVQGQAASPAGSDESLRKVAIMLRNLSPEIRDGLISAVENKNEAAAEKIKTLMVLWSDIAEIADRSLQECLRGLDSREMALALTEAEEEIVRKIRSNISERAAAQLDEEASLMSSPKKAEIEEAREKIVEVLREKNSEGALNFVEE